VKMAPEKKKGLYVPEMEHDSCGIGFVAHLKNRKSHDIINKALKMLSRMEHRGGTGYDVHSGDGAGILIQTPHEFFFNECIKLGFRLPAFGEYGVGVVLFPRNEAQREECREILERNIEKLGLKLLGYRVVPTDNSEIGEAPRSTEPWFEQVFVRGRSDIKSPDALERKLFVLRNYTVRMVKNSVFGIGDNFYIVSFSYKTVVYKGQLTTGQLPGYFLDLKNEELLTALALVHSRFSTNTFPSWRLAQPFRYIAHNGEINTIRGNMNWMHAREALFKSDLFTDEEIRMLLPICDEDASDSANFDMVLELLVLAGRSLPHVLMMMIPEAWQENPDMDEDRRAFYEYHASLMEPWDGPASICFTDGKIVGATLDRNGLRPSRYLVTKDDLIIMASESGVLDIDPANVVFRGRLKAGRIFIADLKEGRIISDDELKAKICTENPYKEWLKEHKIRLNKLPEAPFESRQPNIKRLLQNKQAFGYTSEEVKLILQTMAETGKEPLGSMGADWPIAVLSHQAQHFSSYFKQLFAQVTNPPIDPIRERMVMSLKTYVGASKNLLEESPDHCHKVEIDSPVIDNREVEKLRYIDQPHFQTKTIDIVFLADGEPGRLEKALKRICKYAVDAVEDGFSILMLSDRGLDSDHAAIPSVLATGAVHHHLIRNGLRAKCDIIVETGEVRETHHYATLIGFGASAVNPYLTLESLYEMKIKGQLPAHLTKKKILANYRKAVRDGLLKIFSKMGISTLQSYHGAQIFEALGISKEVIDKHFTGTVSRIGGISLDDIAKETLIKHRIAFPKRPIPNPRLDVGGVYQWKQRGEFHLFNPRSIFLLQNSTRNNDYGEFKKYCKEIDNQSERACTLRSLLKFKSRGPIPIEEVEPIENILKRCATGAMSFGSISHEAHTTLAIAMNRIGGKSNSGEGGEDPIRFEPKPNGDWERSAIKQVASGRFGVTSYYLANADELQIKMAQGAKPGEGGQLPGHKIDEWIGRVRHSTPGVGLISPPPHHDIYSIEDLAQLIFDLKNINRNARISVKLVAGTGVGTIAAGVCKAKADVVLISGHDGGTGASPLSSIRHAGLPWEIGLAETHQTLVRNKLRNRIIVQADGKLNTPRDLAIATLLGAEEWGVATAALIVAGCVMMRKCHLNTCPVGVATQDKTLRERFAGKPEHVVNFFRFMAQGLREIMAELGFRTIDEMVGQAQCLEQRGDVSHWKSRNLDLGAIIYTEKEGAEVGLFCSTSQDHRLENVLDRRIVSASKPALETGKKVVLEYAINNVDRTTGAILSNEISKKYKGEGLPEDTITVRFRGSAGQSFGAFLAPGVRFELEGDANDYFGKGLSGGKLIIFPDRNATFTAEKNIIVGNVSFYGATSGEAYIRGLAGERFCVRNSGANVVVEGIGDHGCEYMTGGVAVILGKTGRNFAAGMSGGCAYVYDVDKNFKKKCNTEQIDFDPMEDADVRVVKKMIEKHYKYTGSAVAKAFLAKPESSIRKFVKVMPRDYKAVLLKKKKERQGRRKKIPKGQVSVVGAQNG